MRAPILEGPQPGALCGQVGGRIGDEGPLEARSYTVNHYVPEEKGVANGDPMFSHYLRANTWPQKFLPESPSLGLGQFSVFSVIGVGQPPCAPIQILRRATREAFPRAGVLLCPQHTEPPRLFDHHP